MAKSRKKVKKAMTKARMPRLKKVSRPAKAKPKAKKAAKAKTKPKIAKLGKKKIKIQKKPRPKLGGKAKGIVKIVRKPDVSVAHAMPQAGQQIARVVKKFEPPKPRGTGELREIRLGEKDGRIKVGLYSEFGLIREDVVEKEWVGEEVKAVLSSAVRTMKPGDAIFISGLGQEELRRIMDANRWLTAGSGMFVDEYEKDGKIGLRIFAGPA